MAKSPLTLAAQRLRNLNPIVFEDFLLEIDHYYDALCQAAVQAPGSEVLQAQGRAQSILALLRILKECHIEPKKQPQPAPQ